MQYVRKGDGVQPGYVGENYGVSSVNSFFFIIFIYIYIYLTYVIYIYVSFTIIYRFFFFRFCFAKLLLQKCVLSSYVL